MADKKDTPKVIQPVVTGTYVANSIHKDIGSSQETRKSIAPVDTNRRVDESHDPLKSN